jgi:hypothetical protein
VAHNLNDVEAIRQAIGADSLAYLSHDGAYPQGNECSVAPHPSRRSLSLARAFDRGLPLASLCP